MLFGIDLAWSPRNNSGMAIGRVTRKTIVVDEILSGGIDHKKVVLELNKRSDAIEGIAVDAPLIVQKKRVLRVCDRELTQQYTHRKIACYPPMTYTTSHFSNRLIRNFGLSHAARQRFILEVYPHPAIVELFGLKERIPYKKGLIEHKRKQIAKLKRYILHLEHSSVLKTRFSETAKSFILTNPLRLRGKALKEYEDGLDAVICLYVAGLWAYNSKKYCRVIGDDPSVGKSGGYIVVPKMRCVRETPAQQNTSRFNGIMSYGKKYGKNTNKN